MAKLVLDTNVYVRALRDEAARHELAAWQRRMAPYIYQHAVVVAELLAGARDAATLERWHERWIAPAERLGRIITPTYGAWTRAARVVSRLVELRLLTTARPGFFNDCLLAASALEQGFTIVTHNATDFRRIARVEKQLSFVAPLP